MSADEQQIQRWLDWLRDDSEVRKRAARHGLAGVFEQRGMLEEAIELLERNVQAGARGAETLRWLSRLYQAQDDQARSLEAEVNASQYQLAPLVSEPARPVEPRAQPTGSWVIRELTPYLLTIVGLGVTLGAGLWMLLPLLKP